MNNLYRRRLYIPQVLRHTLRWPFMFFSKPIVRIAGLTALLFFLAVPASSQQSKATIVDFLDGMLSISASQCLRRGDMEREYERQGKMMEADSARNGEIMICECMPNHIRQLRASLSPQEISLRITEAEFSAQYLPKFLAQCVGEGLRRSFAQGCPERFSRAKPNSSNYCSCMSREVAKFTDLEAMKLGHESADHLPIAAEAMKHGRVPPPQPPLLKRMTEIDATCSRQ